MKRRKNTDPNRQVCWKCYKKQGGYRVKTEIPPRPEVTTDVSPIKSAPKVTENTSDALIMTPVLVDAPRQEQAPPPPPKDEPPKLDGAMFKPIYLLANSFFRKQGLEEMSKQEVDMCANSCAAMFNYYFPEMAEKNPVWVMFIASHSMFLVRCGTVIYKKQKDKKREEERHAPPPREDVAPEVQPEVRAPRDPNKPAWIYMRDDDMRFEK